jgi:hypothetical protein
MESFLRRLKYYGIGFGFGLLFVFFFFQNRGCSWLPSNRVKNSILERLIVIPDAQLEVLKASGYSKKDVIALLNDGDVDFSESRKQTNPKVYLIQKEMKNGKQLDLFFTLPNESFLSEVHFSEKKAAKIKNTATGKGVVAFFPKDDDLVFLDSTELLTCQKSALKIANPREVLRYIKKSGRINFEKTNYASKPKVEQYIEFKDKHGRLIGCQSVWYKNKINIVSFDLPFKSECR